MSQERTWRSGPRTPQELSERQARVRACAAVSFAIRNRQPKIEHSQGGIAQLVERQLCKLEVRGSNPLASISNQRFSESVVERLLTPIGKSLNHLVAKCLGL